MTTQGTETEMLERIAEAICNTGASARSRRWSDWVRIAENHTVAVEREMAQEWIDHRRKEARAALEAMREPTDEMINAGDSYMPYDPNDTGYDMIKEGVWPAMISAALSQKDK